MRVLTLLALSGCSVALDPGAADPVQEKAGELDPECQNQGMPDGVCVTNMACGQPDIDCFTLFSSDEEARGFFARWEQEVAAAEFRAPRDTVPTTDARFAVLRELLDEGWDAYQAQMGTYSLGFHRPALVLVEEPEPNAFVVPDEANGTSAFLVMVNTGLLERGATDDEMLALMVHELQHAVALHLIGNVRHEMRAWYLADDAHEPIGREQDNDALLQGMGDGWRTLGEAAGVFSAAELGGLPMGGGVSQVMNSALARGPAPGPECQAALGELGALQQEVGSYYDTVHAELSSLDPAAGWQERIDDAMVSVDRSCFGPYYLFTHALGEFAGVAASEGHTLLTPEQAAIVNGLGVAEGTAALIAAMRSEMRETERLLAGPDSDWSQLRYFSFEEDADDVTVTVMRSLGREPTAMGGMLLSLIPEETAMGCEKVLAGDIPGYGDDLVDEHHATCWRVHHIVELAASEVEVEPTRAARRMPVERHPLALPEQLTPKLRYLD